MSIRLRLTLLYSTILALTLVVFGVALYTVQAQYTMDRLKRDLTLSGERIGGMVLFTFQRPVPQPVPGSPVPFTRPLGGLSGDQAFLELREREIVRIVDLSGALVASPLTSAQESLPLSAQGLQTLQGQREWWQTATVNDEHLLIYNRPVVSNNQVVYVVQVARTLTERDRSLAALATTLFIASLVTLVIAFVIGWALSKAALNPIHRITQTARAIGNESDFSRRVEYHGPNDEIGQLAKTFNSMLVRLQDAYQQVANSLEMQRNFVADVSHELRTPLTTLRGNLSLLRHQPPLPEAEKEDILADMVDENDRLIRLINDLLVLARAEARRNLLVENFEISPLLDEVCRQARVLDANRLITCEAGSGLTVKGDRDALKQAILILVDNALKHTHGPIAVVAETKDGRVAIAVRDSGPGISPERLKHVFDRFFRGEEAMLSPGYGLGLPIAKALIESMGGVIDIESHIGEGSQVTLRLQAAAN